MTIPFRYVRRKNNPLAIVSYGRSNFEGTFDPNLYEQIEGPLPDNAFREPPTIPLLNRLYVKFESVPRSQVPPVVRGHFRVLQAAVRLSLEADVPDIEAAKALISTATMPDGTPLPDTLTPFQQILLDEPEFNAIP